jgi:chemotaxis protein CheX
MSTTTFDAATVYDIATEVFAAMVDGTDGGLLPWPGPEPVHADPLAAWVDLLGPWHGRATLVTDSATARDLARALLGLEAADEVSHDDLVDAFGEIANVVGGNVKALLPETGTLGLPHVAAQAPTSESSTVVHELQLSWHGRPIVVEISTFGSSSAAPSTIEEAGS